MISKRIENLKPYVPGEQPKDRPYIKLNANENPYPPPKSVAKKISSVLKKNCGDVMLYPDPDSIELKQSYADFLNESGGVLSAPQKLSYNLTHENIFAGNGSDEVLSFIFYAFFDQANPVVIPEHTYSFYPVYAGFYDIPLKKIPLNADFSVDVDAMLDAGKTSTGMIFANPNAPTGIALSLKTIREMLDNYPKDKVFVVDEAYADFGTESALTLLPEYPNLLIVRTSSKSLSFAGMRLGFAVASPELISVLTTVKNSFNHFPVDRLTQSAGIAACKELKYYSNTTKKIVKVRDSFSDFLRNKGWTVLPSNTNFVLAKRPNVPGKDVYEFIKKQGILVRYFSIPVICDFVRITIGTKEQMEQLESIMAEIQ